MEVGAREEISPDTRPFATLHVVAVLRMVQAQAHVMFESDRARIFYRFEEIGFQWRLRQGYELLAGGS